MMSTATKRLAVAAVLAAAPVLVGCADDPEPVANPVTPVTTPVAPATPVVPATPATTPAAGGTVGDPEAEGGLAQESLQGKVGQSVTVRGEVAKTLVANAFTLGGDEIGENPVLVVGANMAQVAEGDTVTVTGTVRRFDLPGVERDLGLDFVDNEFTDFADDPIIQATSVTKG